MPKSWLPLAQLAGEYDEVLKVFLEAAGRQDILGMLEGHGGEPELAKLRPLIERLLVKLEDEPGGSLHLWATDDGDLRYAPAGHDAFIRSELNLPESADADLASGAMANLGWVAITCRPNQTADIAYNEHAVDLTAARTALKWLAQSRDSIRTVRRRVDVNGQWIETNHPTVPSMIAALEEAPSVAHAARTLPWRAERLSVDAVQGDMAEKFLHVVASNTLSCDHGGLQSLLARAGLLEDAALFRIEGGDITILWIGPRLGIDSRWMGRNLGELPDLAYAEIVRSQLLSAVDDGPTLHELEGPIGTELFRYRRLAVVEPPDRHDTRYAATNVVITKRQPLLTSANYTH